jgi:hypothetical protein
MTKKKKRSFYSFLFYNIDLYIPVIDLWQKVVFKKPRLSDCFGRRIKKVIIEGAHL